MSLMCIKISKDEHFVIENNNTNIISEYVQQKCEKINFSCRHEIFFGGKVISSCENEVHQFVMLF